MSNILLFFMSRYAPQVVNGRYKRAQTNEAVLYSLKGDRRPDKIIALCSQSVREEPTVPALDGGAPVPTLAYFMQRVLPAVGIAPAQFANVPVPDSMTEADQAAAIAKIVQNVAPGDTLYIDLSGGLRDTAMLMVAVARYLRDIRDVHAHVFYSELQGDTAAVHSSDKLYDLFDLISATDEFFSTGRAEHLSYYLRRSPVKSAQTVHLLNCIEAFSTDLLLCMADKVVDDISALKKALVAVLGATDIPKNNLDALLYELLNEGFKREFKALDKKATRALPTLTHWCLNHELYQQALTLLSEQMPEFVCDHIFVQPTKKGLDYINDQPQNKGKHWSYPLFHFHFCRLFFMEDATGDELRQLNAPRLRLNYGDETPVFRVADRAEVSRYLDISGMHLLLQFDPAQRDNLTQAILCYQKIQQYRNQINHASASSITGLLPLTIEGVRETLTDACTVLDAIVGQKPTVPAGATPLPVE